MGTRIEKRERITQKSVSLKNRHRDFIDEMETENPNFSVNKILQRNIEQQIAELKPEYLAYDDPRHPNNLQ